MRSLKKLLAVLVALTLMASIMVVPAFAAESFDYEDEAKALYDLGLFKGVSTTEYKPNLDARLIREEGAALVLRLFNLEDEANKMDEKEAKTLLTEKFKDADKISSWAVKIVAYAVKNEIINGRPDGNFAPQDPLLGKEFAKMILAELGQKYDFQTACADLAAISDLTAAEAIKFNDKILIRDDVVGISFATLAATYADGKTVLAVLAEDAAFKTKAMELGLISIVKINTVVEPITIKVGEKVELPAKAEVEYNDGSKAEVAITWDSSAVKTDVAGEYKAVGSVAGFDGTIEVAVTVKEDALKVDSVTADNLKEVVVVYNQDISENAAVADKANYTLDISQKVDAVKVDGNTAILTVADGVANQKKAKLTISDKILTAKEVIEFTFFDASLPEITGLVVTGPKAIELTISEPVKNDITDIKITIKSGTSTISVNKNAITGFETRTIAVPLYSSLVDGKEYEVTVEGFVDYAGYKNKIATFTFVYEKDTTEPIATIDAVTQEYVKVSFNKPVTGLTPGHFSHTFSAWTGITLTNKEEFATEGNTVIKAADTVKTVYVWFYKDGAREQKDERPIAEGDTSFRIVTKNGTEIKDAWGNKFAETTYTISVVADKTAPEVKEIKVTTEQAFTVEFTKSVNFKYDDNLEILDADGKAITGLNVSVIADSAKKYTVDLGKNLKGKTIIVNIKNVKDTTLNTNKLDAYSTTLEIADKTAPQVSKVTYEIVGTDDAENAEYYLYVHFNEDVDSVTALVAGNYFLKNEDAYTKLTGATEFFAGNKIVKIKLTKAQKSLINLNTTNLFVSSVKDIAGNEIVPTLSSKNAIIAKADNVNAPKMAKVEATARDTVVVTFSELLSTYDMDAFTVGGNAVAALNADVNSDGNTVLTLTLEGAARLPYTYTSGTKVEIITPLAITNLFGVSPVDLEQPIVDKIKPELVADYTVDAETVKAIRVEGTDIVIEFTETLKDENQLLIGTDLVIVRKSDNTTLKSGTGYNIIVDDNKLKVNIIAANTKTDEVYKVSSVDSITYIKDDNKGNLAKPFTAVKEVTITALEEVKAAADAKVAADYTEASWEALEAALAKPETTTAEKTAKVAAINNAIDALVTKVAVDNLATAKLAADGKDEAEYTEESWTAFNAAYTAAKALPEITNAQIVDKTAAINAAIAKLVEVPQA